MKKFLKAAAVVLMVAVMWVSMALFYALNQSAVMASLYKIKYETASYPQNGLVLIGSSSIQIWRGSGRDLAPLRSENVGISGSVVNDWFPLVDSLVTPFDPSALVVYVGSNDIHALHRNVEDIAADLDRLLEQIHTAVPDAIIYYISVYTSVDAEELKPEDERFNALAKALTEKREYARFVDCASALLDENGAPRRDVFLDDFVHLNEKGYELWKVPLREALSHDFEELN
ncbi:MAG: GDSL-type esterase/lipase family protein [Oscillospiraceae bacterium]|jgi:hypothetical protein|nr:GDSL-type esterase/lipase family protein [Oscillospiraceae bacterium]